MQYPGYNSGKVTLSEGEWFPFRIHNYVLLQDGANYFVLQDINGLKHFLPAEFYKNYGFNIGDEIFCKIDRINCTGRIFLEPKHPHYEESRKYYFEIVEYSQIDKEKSIIVRDIFRNCIKVPLYGNQNMEVFSRNTAYCIVKNIRKGELFLEITDINC